MIVLWWRWDYTGESGGSGRLIQTYYRKYNEIKIKYSNMYECSAFKTHEGKCTEIVIVKTQIQPKLNWSEEAAEGAQRKKIINFYI